MRLRLRSAVIGAWLIAIAVGGCVSVLGIDDGLPYPAGSAGADAGDATVTVTDGSPVDGGATPRDGQSPLVCPPGDGSVLDGTFYHSMSDPGVWTTFNTANQNVLAVGFAGGTFDGRFVYLAPSSPGNVIQRFDTTDDAGFTSTTPWSTFQTTSLTPRAHAYFGAAFDGRNVYLVPHSDGEVTRYDTHAAFAPDAGTDAAASWTNFDTTTLLTNDASTTTAEDYGGAVFDGQYVYFIPYSFSLAARLDTKQSFTDPSAWSLYDLHQVSALGSGFISGAFDGRYVYFFPYRVGTTTYSGTVVRYDTTQTFATRAAWTTFDTIVLGGGVAGFVGGGFDGRYIYLSPNEGTIATRYDTTLEFTDDDSWATFDTSTVPGAVAGQSVSNYGAAFDGRFVYYIPRSARVDGGTPTSGVVTRYDTNAPFEAPCAWSTFDVATVNGASTGFIGAVYDGRFLYLVPYNDFQSDGYVTRFDTKTSSSMPLGPTFHGSFL